ncbi:MAG: addiction module protein [Elusimicrobia bacterium]|nr:addiction module protein [Elusimicrobiota bacterium]
MHDAKGIIKEAESLPIEERVLIIDSLMRTLNPPDAAIDREWVALAKSRLSELRSGAVKPVPGPEAFEAIRKRLGK